uniref:Uncharacterized protein n=1 Tax=Rhizophora mucronata TaxID=61149 RepID=A0A2P2QJT0_RHIMU
MDTGSQVKCLFLMQLFVPL